MSGICGIVSLTGRPVGPGDIDPMLRYLERRGPEGTSVYHETIVAMGHTLLATTPEALVEKLPLTHPETGCTITSEARLDNRTELMEALDLPRQGRVIGDGELILLSYLKWGEACPSKLLGDFAFAIWDPRYLRLFAAVDKMSYKQLHFCFLEGEAFYFGTEMLAIAQMPQVPRRLNPERLADFLKVPMPKYGYGKTWYLDITKLGPAECISVSAEGLKRSTYWTLEPPPRLQLTRDEEYIEAFEDIFERAISCRLRSAKPVAATLSGGLDSGAVCAVASRLLERTGKHKLKTLSAISPTSQACLETERVRQALRMLDVEPFFVEHTLSDERAGQIADLILSAPDPMDAPWAIIYALLLLARDANANVVLLGAMGDLAMDCSYPERFLMDKFQFASAYGELRDRQHLRGKHGPAVGLKSFARTLRLAASTALPSSLRKLLFEARKVKAQRRPATQHLAQQDFAKEVIKANVGGSGEWDILSSNASAYQLRANGLMHRKHVAGAGMTDSTFAQLAIEPRDPFYDVRLIEFSLSLPIGQLRKAGIGKVLLRNAMRGQLPDATVQGGRAPHLGPHFRKAVRPFWSCSDRRCDTATEDNRVFAVAKTQKDAASVLPDTMAPWVEEYYSDSVQSAAHVIAQWEMEREFH